MVRSHLTDFAVMTPRAWNTYTPVAAATQWSQTGAARRACSVSGFDLRLCSPRTDALPVNRIDVRTGGAFSAAEDAAIFNRAASLFTAPYAVRAHPAGGARDHPG